MIRGLYTASAGMQVEQMRQEVIANNLANLDTSGFQRHVAILQARPNLAIRRTNDPVSADPLAATRRRPIGEMGLGVMVSRVYKRFEQGVVRETGDPFDLALAGEGYFTLQGPNGEKLYTRAGEYTRDQSGKIVDKLGRALLGQNGPIYVPQGVNMNVGEDGSVSLDGRPIDKLALARFEVPEEELLAMGDTAFRYVGAGEPPVATPEVQQGMLEGPNVNSVHEMVEMIAALRHYEANQKALQSQDETLGKAVNEIARG